VIYRIVGSETADALFPGMYVGNALFMYVGALMFGVSWVVIEDREYYRTLKYIYVTSSGIMWYLAGRAVAKFLVTTIAVVVLFIFGRAFLGVPVSPASVDWRSEEHTSELQSRENLVCRLLLEKKKSHPSPLVVP